MAFVDIAYLKKENIENGMINFARRKTGQLLSVRIEPCIQTIIERYPSYSAIYVFPILISTDAEQSYNEYQIAINSYNRLLGKLSKMLPEVCNYHPIPLVIAGPLQQEITMFLFQYKTYVFANIMIGAIVIPKWAAVKI